MSIPYDNLIVQPLCNKIGCKAMQHIPAMQHIITMIYSLWSAMHELSLLLN